jgi:hypothetical protein
MATSDTDLADAWYAGRRSAQELDPAIATGPQLKALCRRDLSLLASAPSPDPVAPLSERDLKTIRRCVAHYANTGVPMARYNEHLADARELLARLDARQAPSATVPASVAPRAPGAETGKPGRLRAALEQIVALDFKQTAGGRDDFYSGPDRFMRAHKIAREALEKGPRFNMGQAFVSKITQADGPESPAILGAGSALSSPAPAPGAAAERLDDETMTDRERAAFNMGYVSAQIKARAPAQEQK